MSNDESDTKENAMLDPSEELPTQTSSTDTSNWDEKVSSDPVAKSTSVAWAKTRF